MAASFEGNGSGCTWQIVVACGNMFDLFRLFGLSDSGPVNWNMSFKILSLWGKLLFCYV